MSVSHVSSGKARAQVVNYSPAVAGASLAAARRLVVPVPNGEFNEQELARKIGKLGQLDKKDFLFLGLSADPEQANWLRRRLAALSIYTRSPDQESGYRLLSTSGWLQALPKVLSDGDLVVCLENHRVHRRYFRTVRLAQLLASALKVPVFELPGIALGAEQAANWDGVREILIWVSNFLTLALFLMLQIRLTQAYPGTPGNILGAVSVVVEFGVLLRLNALH